jgi:hypothetical protein
MDCVNTPRFTMVVLLIDDLPRSLAFYRRLGVEFPAGAAERTDIQVPIGDDHQLVLTTAYPSNSATSVAAATEPRRRQAV